MAGSNPASGVALHAKVIIVDDRIALVGSANLTFPAMEDNLECGHPYPQRPQARVPRNSVGLEFLAG